MSKPVVFISLMLFAVGLPKADAYRVKRAQSKDANSGDVASDDKFNNTRCPGGDCPEMEESTMMDDLHNRSLPQGSLAESKELVLDQAVQTKGSPRRRARPRDFTNLGRGKCESCGIGPRFIYKHGQGRQCENMCRQHGTCSGYSVSVYNNCLLWFQKEGLASGGRRAEWGGAHCVVKNVLRGIPCPVHCSVSWGGWGACSRHCGGGSQTRQFRVTRAAAYGGNACPNPQNRQCNKHSCPIDCKGQWGGWGTCSRNCGGGSQKREYQVTRALAHGGKACPNHQSRPCNKHPCPIDCQGQWGGWNTCSATCGGGSQTRAFQVSVQAQHGGKPCQSDVSQTRSCHANPCPIDCDGTWGEWSACSTTCGSGTQTQTFEVKTLPAHGGTACPEITTHDKECNAKPCVDEHVISDKVEEDDELIDTLIHCEGSWGEWGVCSKSCGGGSQARKYVVTTEAQFGGKACCIESGFVQFEECNIQVCPE